MNARLALSFRALARLGPDEKPRVRGRDAGEGGGLELEHGRTSTIFPSLVPTCNKTQPMIFDVMKANDKNDHDTADIVCDE